jgi:hypothetical protein
MKFFVQTVIIIILAGLLELFLPWWSIVIAAFIGGAIFPSRVNFLAGFLAISILWLGMALIIDSSAAAPLVERVAAIFMGISKTLLLTVTALIGGLVGGFAAMSGGALRKQRKVARYY